jgi:PAS domain S-box-containing protein
MPWFASATFDNSSGTAIFGCSEGIVYLNDTNDPAPLSGSEPGRSPLPDSSGPGSLRRPDIKLLATFHQLNPNPIIGIDSAGRVTFLTGGAIHALASLGKGASPDAFLPKDMDEILAALKRRTPATFQREVTVGDRVFEESIRVAPEFDAVGIFATDITERKQVEQELRAEKERAQNYLDVASVMLVAMNTAGAVTLINRRGCEVLGWAEREALGKDWFETFLPERTRTAMRTVFRRLLAGEPVGPEYVECLVLTRSGDERLIAWHDQLLRDETGGVTGILSSGEDVTARRRAEAALAESELKYRRVFETSNDAMMLLDSERILDCNEATLKVFGYSTRDEFLGKHPGEVSPPLQADGRESRVAADEKNVAAFRDGRSFFEWLHLRADGTVFPADVLLTPFDHRGRKILQATMRDISDRKRAEAALRESEERYRRLVADMGEGMGVGDAEERFSFANRAAAELFGVPGGGLVGRSLLEFLDAEQTEIVRRQTARRRTGETTSYELVITRPDGTKRATLITSSPQYDADGNYIGAFGIFHDITARRQAEQQARAERDQLRRILDAMPDGAYVVGQEFELQYVNPALLARGGPVAGRRCYEYFHRRAEPCPDCVNPLVFAGGTSRREYTTKQGGVTYDIQDVPVTGDDGRPARLAFLRDITARKRAEEALRESEEKYKRLFEKSPSGIALVDTEGVVREANPGLLKLLGIGRDDLVGNPFRQLLPGFGLDLLQHAGDFRKRLAGQPAAPEVTFRGPDGRQTTIDVQSSVVESGGKISGVMFLVTDVTARKRAEAELAKHREHLEELVRDRTADLEVANRELEAFSYSVSHDLRAPLRAIDGFTQILLADCGPQLDAEARGHLGEVSAAARQMAELIDDLLNLARIARLPLERKPVNLSELARTIAGEFREAEPARQVKFVIQDGITAQADPALAGMVLRNLLGNAWKFTSRHETARIEFGETRVGGERVWFVRDDGAGFEMAYVSQLFAPFHRLHTEHDFPGSGIGLAIVHRIVQRHGGRVWIEADVDKGATCRFTMEPASKEA